MILVDTSVWVDHLRDEQTEQAAKLDAFIDRQPLLIGDLILLEILQGARDDSHAARLERHFRRFPIVCLLDDVLATRAAQNYRKLRNLGVTLSKTADLIIGTFCIENGHVLLHDDRDYEPMEKHLGLKVA